MAVASRFVLMCSLAIAASAWAHEDGLPMHVIVSQMDPADDGTPRVLVELIEIAQLARQDRDER